MPSSPGASPTKDAPVSPARPEVPPTPALLAKAALKRLAEERKEPTPDHYRAAYEAEAGIAPLPDAHAAPSASDPTRPGWPDDEAGPKWAALIERIVRGAERGGRQWTAARKKDSLQRVLSGSRQSAQRLHQRLSQLVASWDSDTDDPTLMDLDGSAGAIAADALAPAPSSVEPAVAPVSDPALASWAQLASHAVAQLHRTVGQALPTEAAPAVEAASVLDTRIKQLHASQPTLPQAEPVNPLAQDLSEACEQARRVIEHRHHLTTQLTELVHALTDSLADLAEDDSWVQGQCVAMRHQIEEGLNHRGVRHVQQLLETTRARQQRLKAERAHARDALKALIHTMLQELAELGSTTDRFQDNLGRYADTIGQADSLESLTGVVRELVEESRAVQTVVSQTQQRLHTEHARATELTERVRELEDEIRKLSDEVSTDPLTQIANRRGMMRAFETEQARVARQGTLLAVGLLDVDNFKKLNDQMGHQTGDEALKFLARRVSECLRPVDVVARYGGEEFVVMLPDTPADEAQQVLTRLQRTLSAEFFTHEDRKVFITFSAGVTQYRSGEPIEAALERADVALYEAKRTGKNRTCMA
ncbi:diguanylate cyclase [Aquabacterium fontiphilum]|uniref:GGDEF domain-containing protein n=1 Tax=Aquabacterium fontiphilum TaxID=450365 RepID=UPI001378158A|nr:diguanylate cyclase [Aquabacterium fontiphilum]NBD20884.1 diguanylate cyclase [Aquabacterium fontiphilum]